MRKLNQFESLVVHEFEETKFHLPRHSHTYYEIIYIVKGSGVHQLNQNFLPYRAGDLFVISPDDEHYFDIAKSTRFVYIKFTDSYFNTNKSLACDDFLRQPPETFMRNQILKENVLRLSEPCKTILKNTVANITAYNCRADISTSPIVYYQILSIFGLIRESLRENDLFTEQPRVDRSEILAYIHNNIYNPEKIQVRHIALRFHFSSAYFGGWFKRNFSISYRDYIQNLKLQLIEKRISAGNLSMKEIAHEFGFSDESHLSNYFKKKTQLSPRGFKKSVAL